MMDDLERRLSAPPLAEPGAALDHRMAQLFSSAVPRPRAFWHRPVALWQCLAACMLSLLAGWVVNQAWPERKPAPRVVEQILVFTDDTMSLQAGFGEMRGPELRGTEWAVPGNRAGHRTDGV